MSEPLYDHERYLKEIQEQAIFLFYCRLDTREECFYIRFWDLRPVFDITPRTPKHIRQQINFNA